MKAIVVDDEPIMLRSFLRYSEGIKELEIAGTFQYPEEAEEYAKNNRVDLAILDVIMPRITGIELAKRLRAIRPDMLIVFISAHAEFVQESNEINADYYIIKPYTKEIISQMFDRMKILAHGQKKDICIKMLGRFCVCKNDVPIKINGKAKEILALLATKRGKEVSNEEIYSTLWEERPYGNVEMKVYFNAYNRLKKSLEQAGIENLLISTSRGKMLNVNLVECDYYNWLDGNSDSTEKYEGEFLSEYSWGEYILGELSKHE